MQIFPHEGTPVSVELTDDMDMLLAIYRRFVADADPAGIWTATRTTLGGMKTKSCAVSTVDDEAFEEPSTAPAPRPRHEHSV